MAEYDFRCPNCGQTLRIDEAHQGKKTACPACHKDSASDGLAGKDPGI